MTLKSLKSLIRPILVFGTGLAAYGVTNAALRSNLDEAETKMQKLGQSVGTMAISGLVGERAASYVAAIYDGATAGAVEGIEQTKESAD